MTVTLLKLTLCWSFFALLYTALLRYETFFRANRIYLLVSALLGIVLAALPADQIPVPVNEAGIPAFELPAFTAGLQQAETLAPAQEINWLWVLYVAGVLVALARLGYGVIRIIGMAVRGKAHELPDGSILIQTPNAILPFSFFRWVFLPENLEPLDNQDQNKPFMLMLAHERAHARGLHSADVLLAELLCCVFWFHPLAYWYRKALRAVHEYLADAEASAQSDKKQYGLLLIGQTQSGVPLACANHFFQSPLKQRLIMLTKKASAPARALKFGLFVPVTLMFAFLFRQAPVIAQVVDEQHRQMVQKLEADNWMQIDTVVTFDPATSKESVAYVKNSVAPTLDESGKLVYQYTEVEPQFPGGQDAMLKFLADNVHYPERANKNRAEGTIVVTFVVDETGKVLHPRGKSTQSGDAQRSLEEEAVRVAYSMPNWIPARHKGKAVSCEICIPVTFKLSMAAPKPDVVEPEFPGGADAMMKYLVKNIKYPEAARQEKAEGMAVVQFNVNEDGSLSDFKTLNADRVRADFAAEALRVIQSMPKWKPGLKDGKVVKTQFTLPIKFKL